MTPTSDRCVNTCLSLYVFFVQNFKSSLLIFGDVIEKQILGPKWVVSILLSTSK